MDLLKKILPWVRMPSQNMPWWIIISTEVPQCIYFFGPFDSFSEANLLTSGFVEDLKGENAIGIRVEIQQCEPKELTIIEEEELK